MLRLAPAGTKRIFTLQINYVPLGQDLDFRHAYMGTKLFLEYIVLSYTINNLL